MTPAFRDWIERARAEHISDVLHARLIQLPGRGNKRVGPCPKCGGTDRFAVDLEKELFHCRGCEGKGHGAISFVMFLDEVNFMQAVEHLTGEPPPKDKPNGPTPPKARKARGRFVCAYDYRDELDNVGYQVCRYAEPKSFSQRRPDPFYPDAWIENLHDVRLVPYRLPDLIEGIANGYPVFWVEGEKDADAGAKLGLVTTTTAMGVAGKGHWEKGLYDDFFIGADVVLVPDQDEDEHKGKELARVIAHRLTPVAASVRMLNLPAKDLSLWIEQGGTREDLELLQLEELPATNGHDTTGNGAGLAEAWQPWEPPESQTQAKTQAPAKPVPICEPFPFDPALLPRRAWIIPGLLLRRHVSVLVAPPGSGKSLLTLQLALMMGTGSSWGGWHPRGSLKTLIINSEEDGEEMRRRLAGAISVMGYQQEDLRGRIAYADEPETVIIAKADSKTKTVIRQPMVERIIATIEEGKYDVVIIDPFAETFEGDENSNSELKWCAVLWREIARRTNCAVLLVHHTRKYGAEAGDMDSARGGGALVGVARIVSTLFTMTEREADAFELMPDQRFEYLRFDDAKANLSLITFKARWFFKKTYTLPNGTQDEPPDEVGVLEPWNPPDIFDKIDAAIGRTILLAIDFGMVDEAGKPTGDLFTLTKKGGAKRWAGEVIKNHIEGEPSDKEVQKVLTAWHKNGVLKEVEHTTSTSKGKPRKGLRVNRSRLPGTEIETVTMEHYKPPEPPHTADIIPFPDEEPE